MTEKEILVEAMKVRGFTQKMLAESSGLARQSNVSEMLRSKSLCVGNFVKLLNSMGFDVIVKDRNSRSSENTWKVGE